MSPTKRTPGVAAVGAAFDRASAAGRDRLGLGVPLRGTGMAFRREVLERVPWDAFGPVEDAEYADRLHWAENGERFDLGGTEIVVCESVFRDLVYSRWFFDTRRHALFPGDGFAYAHHHEEGACGHMAEEVPEMNISEEMKFFAEVAFHWTNFVDIDPYIARLRQLMFEELDVRVVAPTHGLPIGDPRATMPTVEAGMRTMRRADHP